MVSILFGVSVQSAAAKNVDDELEVIRSATVAVATNQPSTCINLRIRGLGPGSLKRAERLLRKNGKTLQGFGAALTAIKGSHEGALVDDRVISPEVLGGHPMISTRDSKGLCSRSDQYSFNRPIIKSGNAYLSIGITGVCSNRMIIASLRKKSSTWKISGWESPSFYMAGPPGCDNNSEGTINSSQNFAVVEKAR